MLGRSLVGVQSREAQVPAAGDSLRKRESGRARLDAAAMRADVDLDEDVQAHPLRARRCVQLRDVARVVGEHSDFRLAGKAREPRDLASSHDLVRDEHVGDAAGHQRLGLAHLLRAHADRAGGDLPARDLRALMTLRVRAEPHRTALHRLRHTRDVSLERVQIDDERRRVDVVERNSGGRGSRGHGGRHSNEMR